MSFSPNYKSQFSNPETAPRAAREFFHSLVLIYAPRTILVAKQDIDDCMVRAEVAANESRDSAGGNVLAGGATSSVAGAAAVAAGGVIFGNVGQWAAAGAVGGAVGSPTASTVTGIVST
jgi:hypothetical protein